MPSRSKQPLRNLFIAVLGYGRQDFRCHSGRQLGMQAYQGITVIARSVLETTSAQPQAGSGLGHGRNLGVQLLPQDVCDSDLCALDEIPDHHVPIRDEVQVLAIPHSIFFDTEFHHEIHAPGAQAGILHMITVVDAQGYFDLNGLCA